MKMWLKNIFNKHSKVLNENQQIILLNNLNNLLKSGFTLLESFNFINLYFNYKNKDIANKIVKIIKTGGECDQILELIGYPKSIITQIQFAQKYGNINEALEEAMNYLKTNLQAKQRILKAIQYPIILIAIFITILRKINIMMDKVSKVKKTKRKISFNHARKTLWSNLGTSRRP